MNTWYNMLNKPLFTPPSEYFVIIWPILYVLIIISYILVLCSKCRQFNSYDYFCENKKKASIVFFVQILLNLLWSFFFFNMRSMTVALVDVILLFVVLIYQMIIFYKISKLSALLLVPYLIQVIFAIYLNIGFIVLNPIY